MNLELVDQIAKAVLYEGYMLYPYRPSSVKNQQRWNFGVLYPRAYSEKQVGSDTCRLETEFLVEGAPDASVEIRARFLQLVQRSVGVLRNPVQELPSRTPPEVEMVDSVVVNAKRLQSWQEAVEREVVISGLCLQSLQFSYDFNFPFEAQTEPHRDENGEIKALVLRAGERVSGTITVSAEPIQQNISKLRLTVENVTPYEGSARETALISSLVSAHVVLGTQNGAFVSLLEPPETLTNAASACRNVGVWPVLVGAPGQRDTLLVSPIILYDYPQIAPESAGDLFDGTEIDEILSLRIMTLTDEEKMEMSQSDDRARQILERTETLPPEQLMKLHGVLRSVRPVREDRQ